MVDHGADGLDGQATAQRLAHVDEEDADPLALAGGSLLGRGAGEQHHQVGVLGPRGPHLLAVDHVDVAPACRGGRDRGGVGAGGGLCDAEGLQPRLAGGDLRQPGRLLLRRAVPQHRPHGVHLSVQGGGVAAAGVDLLEDRHRRREAQAAAAVGFGDQHAEIAALGHRRHELGRVLPLAVEHPPVFAGESGAEGADRLADLVDRGVVGSVRGGMSGGFSHAAVLAGSGRFWQAPGKPPKVRRRQASERGTHR